MGVERNFKQNGQSQLNYIKSSLTTIVNNIIEQFGDIGFTGTQRDANTADLKRVIIELSAIVDNKTKYVYSK